MCLGSVSIREELGAFPRTFGGDGAPRRQEHHARRRGRTFAAQALEAGAAYSIIDKPEYKINEFCILVNNVLDTLQQLALFHRATFAIPFIAITGSNGKTSTKELVYSVLKSNYITYATEGNLNNHIGIPLTILKIKHDAQFAIIEMGANHQKEIESYCKYVLPTHGIITNCGKAHIEGFGGEDGVKKGKGELYDFLRDTHGTIFLNSDLEYLVEMSKGITNIISYGANNADYTGKATMNGVFLEIDTKIKKEEIAIKTNLVGEYNFPNVMVAIAVGMHFGVDVLDIKKAIATYKPDNSRSQWLKKGSNNIILDAYNANPTSMKAAILNFADAKLPNKVLWIGGMKEMGKDEAKEHKELVELIAAHDWQDVLLVGQEFNKLNGNYKWFLTVNEACNYVKEHLPINSSILIKGSRGTKMEVLLGVLPE